MTKLLSVIVFLSNFKGRFQKIIYNITRLYERWSYHFELWNYSQLLKINFYVKVSKLKVIVYIQFHNSTLQQHWTTADSKTKTNFKMTAVLAAATGYRFYFYDK